MTMERLEVKAKLLKPRVEQKINATPLCIVTLIENGLSQRARELETFLLTKI